MPRLPNFPLSNQLADKTEVNAGEDCVPTSLASCLEYLTGKQYDGGAIKDTVYGASYQGGTAAIQYVPYCKTNGVNLHAIDGLPAQLIQDIIAQLKVGHPVVITEPSPGVNPSLGWSHVVAMCGYDDPAGTLTVMDPYGGKFVTLPQSEWQKRLEFNEVWVLEKINMSIDINTPGIGDHYTQPDDHHWVSKATGKVIQYAMLSNYKQEGNRGLCGWDVLGDPMSNEIGLPAPYAPGSVKQYYRNGVRVWDAKTGSVTPLALYDGGPGEDPMIATLNQKVLQLETQVAQQPTVDHSAADKLDKIKVIVNS